MSETRRWRKVYKYFQEPGTLDMVKLMVNEIIKNAKAKGKITGVTSGPTFTEIPVEGAPGYWNCIVNMEVELTTDMTIELAVKENEHATKQ